MRDCGETKGVITLCSSVEDIHGEDSLNAQSSSVICFSYFEVHMLDSVQKVPSKVVDHRSMDWRV
jgi:hypothetical protein